MYGLFIVGWVVSSVRKCIRCVSYLYDVYMQQSQCFGETLNGQFFQMMGSDTRDGGFSVSQSIGYVSYLCLSQGVIECSTFIRTTFQNLSPIIIKLETPSNVADLSREFSECFYFIRIGVMYNEEKRHVLDTASNTSSFT